MEKIIMRGLISALIPVITRGIFAFLRQPKKAEKGKVYLPTLFALIGIIDTGVFLIPAMITTFSDEPIWVPIGCFAFSCLGATLIVAFVNCRISFDEDGFTAKSFFGIKRTYTYEQVTALKENMHETYVYVGEHRVMVDEFSTGGAEFIALVKKKYRTLHDGQCIPKIKNKKKDIFNGNVNDATSIIAVFILLAVFLFGFLFFTVWHCFLTPGTEENTIRQNMRFVYCEEGKEDIVLLTEDGQVCKIRYIDEHFNAQNIKEISNEKTLVTVFCEEVKNENEIAFYSLRAIMHNDTYLLTFEETNRLHSQEFFPIVLIAIIMCLVWAAYIVLSVIVGRNPKKFSKKVVRLFFKDGYIKETN